MNSDGIPAALLLAAGVAGLAVVGVVGVHAALPDVAALSPGHGLALSPGASDPAFASPGASDPAPTSSREGLPPEALAHPGTVTDFCSLMENLYVYAESVATEPPGGLDFFADPQPSSDPASVAALHAWGHATLDVVATIVAYYDQAAKIVGDAEVATAFVTLSTTVPQTTGAMAQAAIDATSEADFLTVVWGVMVAPDGSSTTLDKADAASAVIGPYVSDRCKLAAFSGSDSPDLSAKTDVSHLGKEIATYFVDWSAGDPLPVITISEGVYRLNGVMVGSPSDGAAVTGQYANGPTDWCVEVTVNGDTANSYTYSAEKGLQQGTCPSGSA